jgi:hypothetical protein
MSICATGRLIGPPPPRSSPSAAHFALSSTIDDDAEGAAALDTLQHAQHDGEGASGASRATMVDGGGDSLAFSLAVANAASPLSADTVLHRVAQYSNFPTTQAMVYEGMEVLQKAGQRPEAVVFSPWAALARLLLPLPPSLSPSRHILSLTHSRPHRGMRTSLHFARGLPSNQCER